MRILHVLNSLDPVAGGPPMLVIRLASGQAVLGHEVGIFGYDAPGAGDVLEQATAQVPCFKQVRRHSIPPPATVRERLFASRARRGVDALLDELDVVHLHGVWDPILTAAYRAARARGRPYALAPHGMLDPWSLSQKRLKKKLALTVAYRRMLDGAIFLHAGNLDEQRLIEPLGLRPPVEILPNGVFPEEFESLPPPGTFRAARPAVGNRPYVLFLSRLHYKKGLDYLADAFSLLSSRRADLDLVVAGPDEGELEPFRQQVARLGLTNRVHIVGPLWGEDKLAAIVDADCFCLPSRQEGFSMAITEVMACGLPVVISEPCHFPEVREAGAGEVVPLDARAIADALERVLQGPQQRQRMGQAGRELVRSRYTWPHIAEQCVRAYRREIGHPA